MLMLDNDMLIRQNLDELFRLQAPAALKRSSGTEQPRHGDSFGIASVWAPRADHMYSGINAGVMLLQPDEAVYNRMLNEINDDAHPEHIGTFGPEQDYLTRFYHTFFRGKWTHIHAKFNYQLVLPEDYTSSAYKTLDILKDVAVAHYSGKRVKPWVLPDGKPLDAAGVGRLLEDDTVRDSFIRLLPPGRSAGVKTNHVMDGVQVDDAVGPEELPVDVQEVMWEWVLTLRSCTQELQPDVDLRSIVKECEQARQD